MTEIPGQTEDRSFRSVVAGRLFGARWPLAALAACLFAAWQIGGLSHAFAAIVFAVVFATAALAPRRAIGEIELTAPRRRRQAAARRHFGGRSRRRGAGRDPHLRRRRCDAACQRRGGDGVRAVHAGPAAAAAVPRARNAAADRGHAVRASWRAASSTTSSACRSSVSFASPGPASAADGALFVLVFKDQSETRRIDRMRADFIANASHELRTPLASIAGFVETLARSGPQRRGGARAVS